MRAVEKCLSQPADRNETDLCVTEGSVSHWRSLAAPVHHRDLNLKSEVL